MLGEPLVDHTFCLALPIYVAWHRSEGKLPLASNRVSVYRVHIMATCREFLLKEAIDNGYNWSAEGITAALYT